MGAEFMRCPSYIASMFYTIEMDVSLHDFFLSDNCVSKAMHNLISNSKEL